jgi:cytochrome c oxidase assembly protein subunit 15
MQGGIRIITGQNMSEKRNIFEEVEARASEAQTARPGVIDQGRRAGRGAIRAWLWVLFTLVVAIIVVGGLTRLTDSGLSITEWRPLSGAMPPMSQAAWEAEFALYQQIDEFRLQNQWMELSDFKMIYWWEWGHRQLGRVVGLIWALGFFGLLLFGKLPKGRAGLGWPLLGFGGFAAIITAEILLRDGSLSFDQARLIEMGSFAVMGGVAFIGLLKKQMDWRARLLFLGFLGGLQGAIGWWMVASGVTQGQEVVDVASYRLATHLGLAFVILGLIAWHVFQLGRDDRDLMLARRDKEGGLWGMSTGLLHLAFLQILIGALVAGIDAGRSYTDWPTMGGTWFPGAAFSFEPMWRNFFESPGLVQFIHRIIGYLLLLFGIGVWMKGRKSAHIKTRRASYTMFLALFAQVVLGIVTVMHAAPWYIAIFHQLLAVLLWVLILRVRFLAGYPIATSLREGRG